MKPKSQARTRQTGHKHSRAEGPRHGSRTFPVVGIGASAGGYEAFTKFFKKMPANTGMAFVLVQHLDPTHESKLTDLLSHNTRLPVIEAINDCRVEPDHVYVIPPNRNLTIVGCRLRLIPRRKGRDAAHAD